MNTDFKALCDELANTLERTQKALCFEGGCSDATDNKRRALINRARAALAAEADGPAVPEGREPASVVREPSDEELLAFDAWSQKAKELWGEFATERSQGTFYKKLAEPDFLNMVQDSVAYPTLRQVSLMADHCGVTDLMAAKRLVHLALDAFGATPPPPVSVTERLPGPGDCDAEGRCWWGEPQIGDSHDATWSLCTQDDAEEFLTWRTKCGWLPFTALPLPAAEVE